MTDLRARIDANPHLVAARGFCGMEGGLDVDGQFVQYRAIGVKTIANELGVTIDEAAAAMDCAVVRPQQGTVVAGVAIAYGVAT